MFTLFFSVNASRHDRHDSSYALIPARITTSESYQDLKESRTRNCFFRDRKYEEEYKD